jgi:hypothetical protein
MFKGILCAAWVRPTESAELGVVSHRLAIAIDRVLLWGARSQVCQSESVAVGGNGDVVYPARADG